MIAGSGALLAACARPPAGGGGIVSLNPCADAMLVRLVEPGRIRAISRYSHDAGATSLPLDVARRFPATAGTAEEVLALRPDLVVASSFTALPTRAAFERAGLQTLYLGSPATIADSRAQVRELAAAVGAPERGDALVAEIDRAVSAAAAPPPRRRPGPSDGALPIGRTSLATDAVAGPRPSPGKAKREEQRSEPAALFFIGGQLASGSGNLLDELMTRAGFRNAAGRYGLRFTGVLPAETIVAHPPDVVLAPEPAGRVEELRRRLLPRTPFAIFPRRLVNCGGPSIAPALARLAEIRDAL